MDTNIYETYTPPGFSTLNTYIFSTDAAALIRFLQDVFYADEINRTLRDDNGDIANCILQIGNACMMVAQAPEHFADLHAATYLYTNDVDHLFERALEFGSTSIFEPADMDYGDRQGGIRDPFGNYWWISERLVTKGYGEL